MSSGKRPEWAPQDCDGKGFASLVVDGVEGGHDGMPGASSKPAAAPVVRRKNLRVQDFVQGVLAQDRTVLGRAITLVESNVPAHMERAQRMLKELIPHTGNSVRVGITGVPGAGKSTFIEALGSLLCDRGHKVAVLAVDPSSSLTRGSILGDKTRMQNLSRNKNAFIRPSPSSGVLGGVTRKSRETMLICEAAGFDVILVETVGVGQSETEVRSMVDFFLLVLIAGAGDELQGMKKGIMELADAILINKADGDNKQRAEMARSEFERIIHYLLPATEGWTTQALTASSLTGDKIPDVWQTVEDFKANTMASGVFQRRRNAQTVRWVHSMVDDYLRTAFYGNPTVKAMIPGIESDVVEGNLSPTQAVQKLVQEYENHRKANS
ncbi:Putative methylmalonyl-CoA mutase metallochaperone [Desulfatibacillum aliphaticivorans]|uniref:Methylmalonyl-CoA mutase metallochaperone n=1 Tax=Desulfatibacillum aliphaticivorans TaxID=218208 RepID=B8FMR4_DESAL|nr:methylmalonyl Co-A mutase-associated GTPase MeaB [Desulfatibacillum aliphaticivorans]ACL01931.1 Putative methylmalonyl-CoA mutase metallochaperone [Desulfatibacillum aliphaticivorans]